MRRNTNGLGGFRLWLGIRCNGDRDMFLFVYVCALCSDEMRSQETEKRQNTVFLVPALVPSHGAGSVPPAVGNRHVVDPLSVGRKTKWYGRRFRKRLVGKGGKGRRVSHFPRGNLDVMSQSQRLSEW